MPHEIVMPALGMSQDTGLIVSWFKQPGDPVEKGDALFSVETDKATMDIEAQASGFLTDVRAGEGEEMPVGDVVALISGTAEDQGLADAPAKPPAPALPDTPPASLEKAMAVSPKSVETPPVVPSDGRILASPKAKRLANEQGLDLSLLTEAGIAQPYHVADLIQAKELAQSRIQATPATGIVVPSESRHVAASVSAKPFEEFCAWIEAETGTERSTAILAAFAAASLRRIAGKERIVVEADDLETTANYGDPDWSGLAVLTPGDDDEPAGLLVRDLRALDVCDMRLGADRAPALNIAQQGERLMVSLECTERQLTIKQTLALIREFTSRLADPRRHIL